MFLEAELKSPDELLIANSTLTRTKKRTTRKHRERVILDLDFCNNFSQALECFDCLGTKVFICFCCGNDEGDAA